MADQSTHLNQQPALSGPLVFLRGRIRQYVIIEALLGIIIFASAWMWIDLFVDYGSYRLFGIDWVQSLPRFIRIFLLGILALGVIVLTATRIALRLNKDFRDDALALVLENKFPERLNDRLITAIELSSPKILKERGASPQMLQQMLLETEERMKGLPVDEVFDWKRLKNMGYKALALTLGMYLFALVLSIAGAGIPNIGVDEITLSSTQSLHEVLLTWVDRNVALKNVIWPRHTYLEFVGFPESGQVRVGRDAPPFPVKVRAVKYLVAGRPSEKAVSNFRAYLALKNIDQAPAMVRFDRRPIEGWRALSFFDLEDWISVKIPTFDSLPPELKPARAEDPLSFDEIEHFLEKQSSDASSEVIDSLKACHDALKQLGSNAVYRRKFRVMAIPENVVLRSWGNSSNNTMTLQRGANNEYSGQIADLRETIDFTAQALDYRTANKRLVLVPPPMLLKLMVEESHPAYLYYRSAVGENASGLKGLKQRFDAQDMLQSGSDISRVTVPEGTSLVVTGEADADLASVRAVNKAGAKIEAITPKLIDKRTFTFTTENLKEELSFFVEYEDQEGVLGRRGMLLKPNTDEAPNADFEPDALRRTKDGFMVTPIARLPFRGNANDAHGLGDIRYALTVKKVESENLNVKDLFLLSAIPQMIGTHGAVLNGVTFLGAVMPSGKKTETKESEKEVKRFSLPSFQKLLESTPGEIKTLALIKEELSKSKKLSERKQTVRSFQIQPDTFEKIDEEVQSDFALGKLGLAVPGGSNAYQPRYRMEFWLEALDHDVETGPHLVTSKERYMFFIVSENDLLAEIAREEEKHKLALEQAKGHLLESESRLGLSSLDLSAANVKVEQLGPMVARCDEIDRNLETRLANTNEILEAYTRILREFKLNRVDAERYKRVQDTIHEPLRKITLVEFPATTRAIDSFRKALDNSSLTLDKRVEASRIALAESRAQFKKLLQAIDEVLAAMGTLTDINKLVAMLRTIEEEERKQFDLVQKIHEELVRKTLEDALNPGK